MSEHKQRTAGSFADVFLHDPLTLLAGDVAAPVVLAVAALHLLLRVRVVATAAAHQVAAVTAEGGFVALPEISIDQKRCVRTMGYLWTEHTDRANIFPV